jgi:hypothetical protein
MNQIIVKQIGEARTYQPEPQDGQPGEGQFWQREGGFGDRRSQPDGAIGDNLGYQGLNDGRESPRIAPGEDAAAGVEQSRQRDGSLADDVAVR